MKIHIALIVAAASQLSAATKPQLTVEVRNGNFGDIEGLDPKITWEASGESGDFDLEGGVEVAARPTSDLASLPRSIWGKASREWKGWGVSARAELESEKPSQAQVELKAEHDEDDISMKVTASAGKEFAVSKIEGLKGFDSGDDARVTINPRWDVDKEDGDVILGWENDKTYVEVIANKDDQSLRVSRQIDDKNRIAPFLATNGTLAVEWEREIGDDNTISTTVTADESVEIEWKDHEWTANVEVPLDGTGIDNVSMTVKREVRF